MADIQPHAIATPPAHSPNPAAPAFRPSPTRAVSLSTTPYYNKGRAASQPASERLPPPGTNGSGSTPPISGRGSPGLNGTTNGAFGVIGGSRTPGRFSSALAASGHSTRASSFSAGEVPKSNPRLARTLSAHTEELPPSRSQSASPFPTFSPNSTPSTSPAALRNHPLPPHATHSPPKASSYVSRSRSQSLATGVRPGTIERPYFGGTMSTLENTGQFTKPSWDLSPPDASNMSPFSRGLYSLNNVLVRDDAYSQTQSRFRPPDAARAAWEPHTTSALSSSVANALGGNANGNGDNANGNKSGTSSRRHSVSVVGGPGGRREFHFEPGMGMTPMASPPGRGLFGFETDLGNALSLDVSEVGRRNDTFQPSSYDSRFPRAIADPFPAFGSTPARGRMEQNTKIGAPGERDPSGESKDGSQRSRFSFENPPIGSPARGALNGSSPDKTRDVGHIGAGMPRPGVIGSPATFQSNFQGQPGFQGPFPGARPPFGSINNQPAPYGRQPAPGFSAGAGAAGGVGHFYGGVRPPQGFPSQPGFAPGVPYGGGPPPNGQYYTAQNSPPQPTSPSFSTLSLSDLGKGISLVTLPPTTPLYIVTFKAGRRDVFYCPDPTLLISNGDRVIVEADRGSDLGTVVFDQLSPIDVRDWQERQATAALLSGASQHQPPGMAVVGMGNGISHKSNRGVGDLAGMDLDTLLAGVGPGGQLELGGTAVRGPLAKEVMPKRIFAKSSQGPEEQARMREKLHDEYEALMICREKVVQRGLPMQIVDAEYQWDRRKLTFYFKSEKRVDFRDLTKENFRIFKSRIWMSMVPKDDPRV